MVKYELVKNRLKKKITGIVGLVSGVVLTAFIIIAFIGQYVGSFTVTLNAKGKASISLYDNPQLNEPTTFLKVHDLPKMSMYTYSYLPDETIVDDVEGKKNIELGGVFDKNNNLRLLHYLKYTFYMKNTGDVDINFVFKVLVKENIKPDETKFSYDLLDLARVQLFANVGDSHESTVYAKKSTIERLDENGNITFAKPIDGEIGTRKFVGYTTPFESDSVLVNKEIEQFKSGDIIRFTLVMWLDGEDENAEGDQPEDCSFKIGVEISGYDTVSNLTE